jgi:hypothetical protein
MGAQSLISNGSVRVSQVTTGGVVDHNNTNGTCGYCNTQVETLLPTNATLTVNPPSNAVANNSRAQAGTTVYVGNERDPKPKTSIADQLSTGK